MNPDVEALLAKARRGLASARQNLGAGDFDFAVSRAYYAMFYAAEALLLARGLAFSKHGSVIAEFNRAFVRTGELAVRHAAALKKAFEQRLIGDYGFREAFPAETAGAVLDDAEAFVNDAEAYLRRESG